MCAPPLISARELVWLEGVDGEDRAVCLGELGPVDLALYDDHLVSESEDLGVTGVAVTTNRRNPVTASRAR